MDQRGNDRTLCVAEVELECRDLTTRGSLIDVSRTGVRIRYVPDQVIQKLEVNDSISVSGVIMTGPFHVRGVIRRIDPDQGELGVEFADDPSGPKVSALRDLLGAALAGVRLGKGP